jgi:hypothetical protein
VLSLTDRKYILKLVEKYIPEVFRKIGVDPDMKEVGHSYAGPFEREMAKILTELDDNFSLPAEDRNFSDIRYKGQYINIKFGYDKRGQPNCCAGNKAFNYLAGHGGKSKDIKVDSYWILSVDAKDSSVMLYDFYPHLDNMAYNAGPGQYMIREAKMKKDYDPFMEYPKLDEEATLIRIRNRMHEAAHQTLKARLKKINEMDTTLMEKFDSDEGMLDALISHDLLVNEQPSVLN